MTIDLTGRVDGAPQRDNAYRYLPSSLRDEVFAMDICTMREIIQPAAMTMVPLI